MCVPSPSGGVQFCSATYRLLKVGLQNNAETWTGSWRCSTRVGGREEGGRWGRGGEDGRSGKGELMHGRGGEERGGGREGEWTDGQEAVCRSSLCI